VVIINCRRDGALTSLIFIISIGIRLQRGARPLRSLLISRARSLALVTSLPENALIILGVVGGSIEARAGGGGGRSSQNLSAVPRLR